MVNDYTMNFVAHNIDSKLVGHVDIAISLNELIREPFIIEPWHLARDNPTLKYEAEEVVRLSKMSDYRRTSSEPVDSYNEIKCDNLNCNSNCSSCGCDQNLWPWKFDDLSSKLQSPIDIKEREVEQIEGEALIITVPNESVECKIFNDGGGVKIKVNDEDEKKKITLSGSFLGDTYIFSDIHFHWGQEDYLGSEHYINGESFSAEGHIVLFRKEYCDLTKALEHRNGIAALGFFFKVESENSKLDHFLECLEKVHEPNSSHLVKGPGIITSFLSDLMATNKERYYAYPGSLTSPPYEESVTFLVLPYPLPIGSNQLEQFRALKGEEGDPILSNRREIQPQMQRPVFAGNAIVWNYEN